MLFYFRVASKAIRDPSKRTIPAAMIPIREFFLIAIAEGKTS